MKSTLCLALTLFCFIVNAADIFLLDCEQNFYIYPKPGGQSAFALNMKDNLALNEIVLERYTERFSCVCPKASKQDLLKVFGIQQQVLLPDLWFNYLSPVPERSIPGCDHQFPDFPFMPYFAFPETCNWKRDRHCLATFQVAKSIELDFAVAECPNSIFPLISVSCNGAGCDTLMMPCVSDNECGGALSCNPFNIAGQAFPGNTNVTEELLTSLLLQGVGPDGKCDVEPKKYGTKLANYIRTTMFNTTEATFNSDIKFCLPGVIDAETFYENLNETTRLLDCEVVEETKTECVANNQIVEDPSTCPSPYWCESYNPDGTCEKYQCDRWYFNETTMRIDYDICTEFSCMWPEWIFNETSGQYDRVCEPSREVETFVSVNCVKNNGPLTPWKGIRPDGSNILDWTKNHPFEVPSLIPQPKTDGANVIIDLTCDETFQYFPTSKLFGTSASMHKVIALYNFVYDAYRERANCEANLRDFKLDDSIFGANYFLPSLLALYTANEETFRSVEIPMRTFAGELFSGSYQQIRFPWSCDYNSWRDNGKCEATYTGLSTLFGIDVTFNVALSKCSFREFPSVYVECVGEDCDLLQTLVPCDPNNRDTCRNGECISPLEFIFELSQGEPVDFISQALGTDTPACPATNTTMLVDDMNAIFRHFNLPANSNICIPSIERISQTYEGWIQTQFFQRSDGSIELPAVKPWTAPQ